MKNYALASRKAVGAGRIHSALMLRIGSRHMVIHSGILNRTFGQDMIEGCGCREW